MSKIKFLATLVILISLSISIVFKESANNISYQTLKDDAVVIAFGDSLTYGYGVDKKFSYPSQLENKTGLHVINAGVSGEESSEGLLRLPSLLKLKPNLVILCHGGNDILRKRSHEQLKMNLLKMINLIKESGSEVLLVGVADFGLLGFKTLSVYNDVAEQTGVMYEENMISYIESKASLKSDNIHPNEKGYEMIADSLIKILKSNKLI
ncbi:GDSL-type esterase/lipase family protein [Candidatus Sulfurimonas baltica]|uniref:Arylesterase n=1 Tax=Candidatus Sulfurimonas baltica TaxID=2740404 RepID=A0A7S7RMG8_9BACT|nr:GDSL-type esterase/lipase family protein [Candidatus Sulfurimonas baltica]QOY51403.1 arylesterase [Candidatus Sulfurimonas baltica]